MTFLVQHIRSGEFAKRPSPQELATGQLAVNYNQDSVGLFFKTDAGTLVKAGPMHVGTTAPSQVNWTERSIGEMWLDTSVTGVATLKVWTAYGWTSVSTTTPLATTFIPPTSATGLPSGAVWNNNGVLTIVP